MKFFGGRKEGELPAVVDTLRNQSQPSDSVNVGNNQVYGSDGSVINLEDNPQETK